jgi:phospholipid/cholesterol/gamma-HCH transport system substrate-binding protein
VDNLVGDQFVDVTSGASRRPVEDGGEIAYKARPPLLRRLDLGGFERQLRAVDATLTDIELGRSRVGQFVVGETVYADLRRRLRELDRGLRIANDSTTAVGKLIYTDALDRKLLDPLRQLDRKLAQWQAGAGTYGKLLRDETSYEQLRRQAAGWRESLAHWRAAGPLTSDSAYLDWSREVASVVRAVDQFTSSRAFASPQPYQDLAAAMNNLSAALAKLQRNPRKVIRFKLF